MEWRKKFKKEKKKFTRIRVEKKTKRRANLRRRTSASVTLVQSRGFEDEIWGIIVQKTLLGRNFYGTMQYKYHLGNHETPPRHTGILAHPASWFLLRHA